MTLDVTDLNTSQILALDRSKTVAMLTGGMLEEHGPYLPAFTDGILDGADPTKIQRYADRLFQNPVYQERRIKPAEARDEARGARQREWLTRRRS